MCDEDATVLVLMGHDTAQVTDPRPGPVTVDACIAAEVRLLNVAGIRTTGSCCGHGRGPGWIAVVLEDAERMRDWRPGRLGAYEAGECPLPNYAGAAIFKPLTGPGGYATA